MATTLDSRPTATTYDVEALVTMAWSGRIRVPHFQRDFRWSWEDVRRLFDSIVKGYPIGSLLLWTRKASRDTVQLGALRIAAPAASDAMWVVDGQQRLTSLANALHSDGQTDVKFALAYDLVREEFVRTPAVENPLVIPLPVLFNLQQILKWFARYGEISERYLDEATNITRRIRQFEVPAYLVSQDNPSTLQDIFDRMNNYGKRLSRAEIFAALNAGDEDQNDSLPAIERIAERIDLDLKFGKIDNDTVLNAILARRGPEVRRDIRSEFTKENDEGRDAAYQAGEEALRRAVSFLQNEAGVPHIAMLAYRYLIVVLTRLFAFHPQPDSRHRLLLRRWYWRAAAAGPERFKGGTPNAARVLCTQVSEASLSDSVQGLLSAVSGDTLRTLDLSRFATNEAATKMLLCVWWASSPRNPLSGEQYELSDLSESLIDQQTARDAVRYIVQRRTVSPEYRKWAAARALMPQLDVDINEISSLLAGPSLDLGHHGWVEVLESHGITPDMASYLEQGDVTRFVQERNDLLKGRAAQFLSLMAEEEFEDTPPLAEFEVDDEVSDAID
ncbi:MAG TPA: DUF262 domain-containing protein [Actinophytocola sp.]|uniref:DUF262 domain-containing protein n=1 Tax=Actinophytocola sp. TaxID=1872138 RepID=UPI002DB6E9B8|nr:DUF262 domain-containing protein [Actinophytocola sp.]HEU5472033.1 DUF262 domain-containing protein [Actinophytocola sp.]